MAEVICKGTGMVTQQSISDIHYVVRVNTHVSKLMPIHPKNLLIVTVFSIICGSKERNYWLRLVLREIVCGIYILNNARIVSVNQDCAWMVLDQLPPASVTTHIRKCLIVFLVE